MGELATSPLPRGSPPLRCYGVFGLLAWLASVLHAASAISLIDCHRLQRSATPPSVVKTWRRELAVITADGSVQQCQRCAPCQRREQPALACSSCSKVHRRRAARVYAVTVRTLMRIHSTLMAACCRPSALAADDANQRQRRQSSSSRRRRWKYSTKETRSRSSRSRAASGPTRRSTSARTTSCLSCNEPADALGRPREFGAPPGSGRERVRYLRLRGSGRCGGGDDRTGRSPGGGPEDVCGARARRGLPAGGPPGKSGRGRTIGRPQEGGLVRRRPAHQGRQRTGEQRDDYF